MSRELEHAVGVEYEAADDRPEVAHKQCEGERGCGAIVPWHLTDQHTAFHALVDAAVAAAESRDGS